MGLRLSGRLAARRHGGEAAAPEARRGRPASHAHHDGARRRLPLRAIPGTVSALVAPRRFRRRLTVAFVTFVGVSSGVLAIGSYFMFREYRLRLSATQADRRVALALPLLPANPDGAEARHALAEYRRRGGFEAVVVTHGHVYSSLPGLGAHDIPADLRAGLTRRDHHTFTTVAGSAYRVVGRLADDGNTRLYFFFARAEVLSSITLFGNVLVIAWLGTVAFAAVAGQVVSRRTLRPIREAALASRRLA